MITKYKDFLFEKNDNMIFLGYHVSMNIIKNGYSKGVTLDEYDYFMVIQDAYIKIYGNDLDVDIDELDDDEKEEIIVTMNDKLNSDDYGFTFVSEYPIERRDNQTSLFRYGNYVYMVYGDGSELIIQDEITEGANIIVSKKPLYFKNVTKLYDY